MVTEAEDYLRDEIGKRDKKIERLSDCLKTIRDFTTNADFGSREHLITQWSGNALKEVE